MLKPNNYFEDIEPKREILRCLDERMKEWGAWARQKVRLGIDYPKQSVIARLIDEGLLVRERQCNKGCLPCHSSAEEIEDFLKDMSSQYRLMADTVREMYLTEDRIENKARRNGTSVTLFNNYLSMGRWWLVSRISFKAKLKLKLKQKI
jgi:hypothetical protein